MNSDTRSISNETGRLRSRARGSATITENDGAIRNLKASQSVEAAFQAAGIPSPPGDIAAIITNHVKSEIQTLSLSEVANMSPGGGQLAISAAAAVNQFVSSLNPSQREAVKAGVNPLDATGMMKLGSLFKSDAGNFGRLSGRDGTDSSARYDGMGAQGLTQTQLQARDLAIKSGLLWAANNPDLLRLGPSAIQALAESRLKEENYKILKDRLDFSDKDVVAGAKYSNRNHLNYNDITKSTDKAVDGLKPEEKKDLVGGVKNLFHCKPEQEGQCKADFNARVDRIKKSNPGKAQELDRLQKSLGTQKKAEVTAKATVQAAKSGNDDLMASLNAPATTSNSAAIAPAPASATQTAAPPSSKVDTANAKTRLASAAPKPGGVS